MFKNREEAGLKLELYRNKDAVVVAIPRGGVITGHEIAKYLSLPLDIVAVRKIGHPLHSEYAIGAVDENGEIILNQSEIAGVEKDWLEEEIYKQQKEAKRRGAFYRDERDPFEVKDRIVILADDGIATGFTMRLAVKSIKKRKPKKIIVAVPVAPIGSINDLKEEGADEIIALEPPEMFMGAVGAHYLEFEQVSDEEVINFMETANKQLEL